MLRIPLGIRTRVRLRHWGAAERQSLADASHLAASARDFKTQTQVRLSSAGLSRKTVQNAIALMCFAICFERKRHERHVSEGAPVRPGRRSMTAIASASVGWNSSAAAPSAEWQEVRTPAILYLQQRPPVCTQRRSATSMFAKYLSWTSESPAARACFSKSSICSRLPPQRVCSEAKYL